VFEHRVRVLLGGLEDVGVVVEGRLILGEV